MTQPAGYAMSTLRKFVGREVGVSGWTVVDQRRIDGFLTKPDAFRRAA
jgi:hypothetical protein